MLFQNRATNLNLGAMKRILNILAILSVTIDLYCQPIINIENQNGEIISGAYYKDVNNLLNPYVGVFVFQNNDVQIEISLQKRQMENINNMYFEDILIGEYRYVKNGEEISNTISNLNVPQTNPYEYSISGNTILVGNVRGCDDCSSNEKRVELGLSDGLNDRVGNIIIRRIYQSNQEFFQFSIMWSMRVYNPIYSSTSQLGLPTGDFLFTKL